jgi:hypothetical protein
MLVTLFLCLGNLRFPSPILHDVPGSKNGVFVMVVSIDASGIFNQVVIFYVPPMPIAVTDSRNIPGGVANGTGYELA